MLRLILCLNFVYLLLTPSLFAQTPRPFTMGTLPDGWKEYDVTADNNGIFKLGLARVLKGDSDFGFLYEGGEITIEQSTKTLDEWKTEVYGHMNGQGRFDSQKKCQCTRLGDNATKLGGYSAYFVGELQRCYLINGGTFEDEDNIRSYYIQVGKIGYSIYTESDSEKEGGTGEYEREIDEILNSIQFFGGSNDNPNNNNDNNNGNNENTNNNSNTNTTSNDDSGWSVGQIVVGTLLGGGIATAIGIGIRAIGKAMSGGKNTVPQNNQPIPQNSNNQNPLPPKKRKEEELTNDKNSGNDEDKNKEDDKKEDEQPDKFVLQLSKQQMELGVGNQDSFQVAVWQISSKGQQKIAQNAQIQLSPTSNALQITPMSAQGATTVQVTLTAQPDANQVFIEVSAHAGSQQFRTKVQVNIKKSNDIYEFVTTQMPPDKQELVADGHDAWFFYAQVRNPSNLQDPESPKLTANIHFAKTGANSEWLDLGEQKLTDGWQAVGFKASHPQPHLLHPSQVVQPPSVLSLEATVTLPNGNVLRKIFDFPIQQPAILDVNNDTVYFPTTVQNAAAPSSMSNHFIEIQAFIEKPIANEKWTFTAEYEKGSPALTKIEIVQKVENQAIIRLKTPALQLQQGQTSVFGHLIIHAQSNKRKAANDRQVNITLRAEGIFIQKGLKNNVLEISGEPEKAALEAEIVVYLWDEKNKTMIADRKAAEQLVFDFEMLNAQDKQAKNLLSVAKIAPKRGLTWDDGKVLFEFKVSNEIPGDGKVLPFKLLISTDSAISKQHYDLQVDAGIFAEGIGAAFEDWEREYEFCKRYIDRHVPEKYKPDISKMLEDRKMALGAEGLYYLRHKIHSITQNLILAEGAQGYRDADKWYSDMIELLEWCEWAGNLAFSAVAASVFGAYAPAVTIAKSYGIQALQYVLEGKTLEDWVYDCFTLHTLFKAAEGRLIDVSKIAEYFKKDGTLKSYAKAWAIFIAYHFAYNVFWDKKSVVEGLKQVAREIRDEAIVEFFQKRLKAEGEKQKDGMELMPDPISKLKRGFVAKANGQHECNLDDVTACMRDPQAMRSLKKASPELQEAFNRTRNAMYEQHDTQVKNKIAERMGIPAEDLKIDDFRTPGADPTKSINTDRDYRMLYRAGKDANGKDIWFEVPRERWESVSYDVFGQVTNKPAGMSNYEWAQKHMQLATDKYHIEASPDYSDHCIDPKTGEKVIIRPNILAVEEGTSRLFDAEGLGNMYHEKTHASLRVGQLSEAFAQCKKGVETLKKVREGYNRQNLAIGKLPKSLEDGMEIVKNTPTDQTATPEALANVNAKLKEAGFHDLEDFSNKMASQFQSLKQHDQQPNIQHEN